MTVPDGLLATLAVWHDQHPGEGLTLTGAQVAELAGCADPDCAGRPAAGDDPWPTPQEQR